MIQFSRLVTILVAGMGTGHFNADFVPDLIASLRPLQNPSTKNAA